MVGGGYEGGGAGGKLRKKVAKKAAVTPYDRPIGRNNPTLFTKLVKDPLSKLAHLFFSSINIKRITAPVLTTTHTVVNQDARVTVQETVIPSPMLDQVPAFPNRDEQGVFEKQALEKDSGKQIMTSGNGGLSELELMLKHKTFNRSEIDRLTELLHSKTVVSSSGHVEKSNEFIPPLSVSGSRGKDNFARIPLQETRNESHLEYNRFDERVSTAVISSKVLEEDVATPAELAKAYMGNRSSKVSPSVLSLRSQATREDPGPLCNSPFAPRSPVMALVQKPSVYGGVNDNGFITPRSRGRSAIYSMARTPYSRIHPTASPKGNSSIYDGCGGSSASPSTGFARELVARSVSKDLALKRRSSVLEDEIGSVGPIRRLRQKTNLSTPKNTSFAIARTPYSSHGAGIVTNGTLDPSSSSKTFQSSKDNENMPATSCTPVPSQSKETARKILQQLEKLTPKEKQLEDKVGAVNENSPSKLMPNMLHGQALRSLENVDSSKILQGAEYDFNYKQKGPWTDACETSSSRKHDKIEENGPRNFNVSNGSLAPEETGNGTVVSKDAVPAFSFTDAVKKQVVTQPSQKKWGFQMSAHEDFLDQDDEIHPYEAAAPAKLVERKKFPETSVVGSKAVSAAEDKTCSASEFKAPIGSSEVGKAIGFGASDGTKKVDISSGSVFSDAPAASMSFPSVVSVSKSTAFTNNISDQVPSAPPVLFSSGAKTDDKVTSNTFSSSPFGGGSFGLKSTASTEVKQDFTNSLATNTSDVTETVTKPTNSVNGGVEKMHKPDDVVGKSENVFSLPQSTSASTSSLFTVGTKANFSSLSKDSLNSTTPSNVPVRPTSDFGGQTLSASTGSGFTVGSNPSFSSLSNGALKSTTPTSESGNQTPSNLFTGFAFTSTAVSSEAATPSFSAATSSLLPPAFKFGSTVNGTSSTTTTPTTVVDFKPVSSFVAPPTYATVSTTSSATDVKGSTEKETSLGNLSNNPFSAPSSQMTGSGSSVFAFNASSTSSPSAASLSQGSLFSTSSGTSISTQSVSVLGASAPSSVGFSFGAQPAAFTSSAGASASSSPFSFSTTTQKQSVFSSNGDKMTMADDSMSEDLVQAGPTPTSSFAVSGQIPASNPSPSPFVFGGTAPSTSGVNPFQFGGQPSQPSAQNPNPFQFGGQPSQSSGQNPNPFQFGGQPSQPSAQNSNPFQFGGQPSQPSAQNPNPFQFGGQPSQPSAQNPNPFQFGGQPSQPSAQNPNPFQPSGGQDFAAGGSFSLGSVGDGDKSGRRIIKVNRKNRRK